MEDETAVHDENTPAPSTATTVKMLPRSVATQICTSQVSEAGLNAVEPILVANTSCWSTWSTFDLLWSIVLLKQSARLIPSLMVFVDGEQSTIVGVLL